VPTAPYHGSEGAAIVGLSDEIRWIRWRELEGVHEIAVQALCSERNAVDQRMRPPRVERVPAHMGDFQIGVGRPDAIDLACYPSQALRDLVFPSAFGHELHADADAEKGPPARAHALVERFHHPTDGVEPAPAIRKRAHPRQYNAVGASHPIGIARDRDLDGKPCFAPGAFERLGGRMQVARPIIHDGDDQRDPPG
jgi:hypothetical protein